MAKVAPSSAEPVEIGRRARVIRCHLGLSLDVVAGLAGMDERHLARVETGKRHVDRMGQVEDLAAALGCSVVDLTGQPYLPADRASADTLAVVPGIREALCDTTVDDPPGGPARPVGELAEHVRRAAEHLDQDRYPRAGGELGALLSELHVRAGADDDAVRGAALAALMTACRVAAAITGMIGYHDLALIAARRGLDAADRLGDPVVTASARLGWARTWLAVGARPQAEAANERALADLGAPSAPEAVGLLGGHHLLAARLAARAGRADAADHHLDRAGALAARTGERTTGMLRFGPIAVALWTLLVDVDLGRGVAAYERAQGIDVEALHSRARTGAYHLALACALAQDGGDRDDEAIRHLALADQAAPVRTRNHPIVRELTEELTRRARRQLREVDSLLDRFGLAGQRPHRVNI